MQVSTKCNEIKAVSDKGGTYADTGQGQQK
jgi:hypothetical protein